MTRQNVSICLVMIQVWLVYILPINMWIEGNHLNILCVAILLLDFISRAFVFKTLLTVLFRRVCYYASGCVTENKPQIMPKESFGVK